MPSSRSEGGLSVKLRGLHQELPPGGIAAPQGAEAKPRLPGFRAVCVDRSTDPETRFDNLSLAASHPFAEIESCLGADPEAHRRRSPGQGYITYHSRHFDELHQSELSPDWRLAGLISLQSTQPGIEAAENKVKFWALCQSLVFQKGELIASASALAAAAPTDLD